MSAHSPTPWKALPIGAVATADESRLIANFNACYPRNRQRRAEDHANAEFVVRACNAHDELLGAAEALLGALPADLSMLRAIGLDTAPLNLARLRAAAAIAKAEGGA
jgi:hypothetical protein